MEEQLTTLTTTKNRRRRSQLLLLVVVILVVTAVYVAGVPNNPPGFYLDESSIAYNAHTISQTGRDEFGVSWPLYFRAFGEYKNPTYIYLLAALYHLFEASILVARLLSVTLGLMAALLLGILAKQMTGQRRIGMIVGVTALLTPWFFELSRLVLEVALYPLALLLFARAAPVINQSKMVTTQCVEPGRDPGAADVFIFNRSAFSAAAGYWSNPFQHPRALEGDYSNLGGLRSYVNPPPDIQ